MTQEVVAGIILCTLGLIMSAKPTLIWKIAESWKTGKSKEPSALYMKVLRIVSGAAIGLGVLLVSGILK